MKIVVCYDVVDDGRRTRLSAWLAGFGDRVQRSVFECDLDARQRRRMDAGVTARVNPREDSVIYYTLCAACEKRVEALPPRSPPAGDVVV